MCSPRLHGKDRNFYFHQNQHSYVDAKQNYWLIVSRSRCFMLPGTIFEFTGKKIGQNRFLFSHQLIRIWWIILALTNHDYLELEDHEMNKETHLFLIALNQSQNCYKSQPVWIDTGHFFYAVTIFGMTFFPVICNHKHLGMFGQVIVSFMHSWCSAYCNCLLRANVIHEFTKTTSPIEVVGD